MKKLIALSVLVLLVTALIISPTPAFAGGRNDHGGHHGYRGHGHYYGGHIDRFMIPRFWRGPVYEPPVVVIPAPPPFPSATLLPVPKFFREVVYPHGRYVLYGDGVSSPYKWVWIPNPPAPPAAQ